MDRYRYEEKYYYRHRYDTDPIIVQLRNITYRINVHRFINMADIEVKPRSVLPTY